MFLVKTNICKVLALADWLLPGTGKSWTVLEEERFRQSWLKRLPDSQWIGLGARAYWERPETTISSTTSRTSTVETNRDKGKYTQVMIEWLGEKELGWWGLILLYLQTTSSRLIVGVFEREQARVDYIHTFGVMVSWWDYWWNWSSTICHKTKIL